MNYLIGVFGVLLVQLAISYVTILAGTGNGSFIGLGAMIFGLYGIPATTLINFFIIRGYRKNPQPSDIKWLIVISSILPILQLALLIAQKTLNL